MGIVSAGTVLVMAGIALVFFAFVWLLTALYQAVARLLDRLWPDDEASRDRD